MKNQKPKFHIGDIILGRRILSAHRMDNGSLFYQVRDEATGTEQSVLESILLAAIQKTEALAGHVPG